MYENNEEIQQKLGDCIISYKGIPYLALGAGNKSRTVLLCEAPSFEKRINLHIDDPDIDYRNLGSRLGYINFDVYAGRVYKEATYSMRIPARKVHQGLCRHNVYISGFKGDGSTIKPPTNAIQFDASIFGTQVFINTFIGRYPSVSTIKEEFSTSSLGVTSRAFDRRWAFSKTPTGVFAINYKYETIGYTEDFHRAKIQERFKFLRRDFSEVVKEEIKVA